MCLPLQAYPQVSTICQQPAELAGERRAAPFVRPRPLKVTEILFNIIYDRLCTPVVSEVPHTVYARDVAMLAGERGVTLQSPQLATERQPSNIRIRY
jgi:hypothetical protein